MESSTFQPGDICVDCQQQGLNNRLRTFFIDLNEKIVKCESSSCLYPYENDFSDSEDGKEIEVVPSVLGEKHQNRPNSYPITNCLSGSTTEKQEQLVQSNCSKPSLDTLEPINDANIQTNDYDDTESTRFVEALLCIGDGCDSTVIGSNNVTSISEKTAIFEPPVSLSTNTMENIASSFSIKPETFDQNPYSNGGFVVTEGVTFIDSHFTDLKAANLSAATKTRSLESQQLSHTVPAPCKIPILNYDLTDLTANTEPSLPDGKKKRNSKIHIQSIKTFKAEAQPLYNFKSNSANDSKSEDFIKTEKNTSAIAIPTAVAVASTNSPKPASTDRESKTYISRYFEAIREREEMLENDIIKTEKNTSAIAIPTAVAVASTNSPKPASTDRESKTYISRYFEAIREREEMFKKSKLWPEVRKKSKSNKKRLCMQKPQNSELLNSVVELVQTKKQK